MDDTQTRMRQVAPRMTALSLALCARYSGLLSPAEAQALAMAAAMEAWRKRPLASALAFEAYACVYARGGILKHVRQELRQSQIKRPHNPMNLDPTGPPHRDDPRSGELHVSKLDLRKHLPLLSPKEKRVLHGHVFEGRSLALIAALAGRQRTWSHRVYRGAIERLRRAIRGSRCPQR